MLSAEFCYSNKITLFINENREMNDGEEEDEIKIEYFESLEVDPLSKSNESVTKTSDFIITEINCTEMPNEEETLDCRSTGGDEITINDENNDPVELEDESTWYKSVNNAGKYVCKFCDLCYSTVQTLRNHIKNKHTQHYNVLKNNTATSLRKQKIKCHVCKLRFKNTSDLKVHIHMHGLKDIQKSCPDCHATFENIVAMRNHVTNEHKSLKPKLHFCPVCGYSTSKLSHFKQHENTHSFNNKKKCTYCDYSTNYLPNLKIHERIHSNDKPYVCGYNGCGYRCAAKSALYSHQLKHDREKNMLYCDKCRYSTVYKQTLKKHLDSHSRNTVRKRFY